MAQSNSYHDWQKRVPYPPCHRDNFAAKEPGLVAGWLRRVMLTYFIAVPLGCNNSAEK
jgi:hypothetical protein